MRETLAHPTAERPPTWQCVLICWGTRYSTELINNLIQHIARHASRPPQFVLITDRPKPGLLSSVRVVPFPEYWIQPELLRSGCQAKLAMFERGVLDDALPAVYIDLDTVVLGDMVRVLELMTEPSAIALLQSAILPFGPIGRWVHRRTQGRRYARGNSSVVVFHPAHHHAIAERFRAIHDQDPAFSFRPTHADERFISWVAQAHARAIPKSLVVKFPGEFMFPLVGWLKLRALLPWVKRRREGLVAVTLCGLSIKPEMLLALPEGARLIDEKRRVLIWSRRVLGPMQQRIRDFYAGQVLAEGKDNP